MGEEIDVFLAQLVRENKQQPWGFRMEGGYDTHVPLRIALVSPYSPSAKIGLQQGDAITKIFNRQTKFLSHKQATEILMGVTGKELDLTIERVVKKTEQSLINHLPVTQQYEPDSFTFSPDQDWGSFEKKHGFFPDFGVSQTFRQTAKIQLTNSKDVFCPQSSEQFYTYEHQLDNLPNHYTIQQSSENFYKKYMNNYEDERNTFPPQSQTFRKLQNYMENTVSVSGPRGLPGPRSLNNELMRNQERMKVIMPQHYNNPMSMYSSANVLETFQSQIGSMLNDE